MFTDAPFYYYKLTGISFGIFVNKIKVDSGKWAIGSFQSMHPIFDLNIVEHYVVISW
jgi:hypothetical protein